MKLLLLCLISSVGIQLKYDLCKVILKKIFRKIHMMILSGDSIQCPICGWRGSRFKDGSWHKRAICPQCDGDIRHRLIMASFLYLSQYRSETFLAGKKILHRVQRAYRRS